MKPAPYPCFFYSVNEGNYYVIVILSFVHIFVQNA